MGKTFSHLKNLRFWNGTPSQFPTIEKLLDFISGESIANWYSYDNAVVDTWLADGVTTDEIEEFLYCGEL